jgi:hypothetical protein
MQADHRAIFIMPGQTRIAMAQMASFSVRRVGIPEERVHFAIPFRAEPDQVRIRAGRTFRSGWRGTLERRLWHPFMNWMQDHVVTPRTVNGTLGLLRQAEATREKILLFGGWVQLHSIAKTLQHEQAVVRLAPGSLIGTGGGLKERYPSTPEQISQDLAGVFELVDAQGERSPIPIRDVYGMAEANWAAMQCQQLNYHIPPWIYARTLDEDGRFQESIRRTGDATGSLEGFGSSDSGQDGHRGQFMPGMNTGLLAFYDPFGGGDLFPAFFRTADRVTLVAGAGSSGTDRLCPCGEAGAYITRDSIQRVDLLDEAGCAAQI